MTKSNNHLILFIFLLVYSTLLNGCTTTRQSSQSDNLPILSQDEIIRPYTRLGRIRVTRELYASDYSLTPDITAWGMAAVRREADKMGADAVMLLEVTGRTTSYGIVPSTEYNATGFAIKFK